jgi:hypothetical protein
MYRKLSFPVQYRFFGCDPLFLITPDSEKADFSNRQKQTIFKEFLNIGHKLQGHSRMLTFWRFCSNRLPAVAKLKFAARYPSLFLINLFPGTLGKGRILLPLNLCISRRELLQAR